MSGKPIEENSLTRCAAADAPRSDAPGRTPASLSEPPQSAVALHPKVPRAVLHTEQARSLYAGIPVSLTANALIALILVAIQRSVLEASPIITWLTLLGGTLVLRAVVAATYRHAQASRITNGYWLNWFRIGVAATGLAWSAASLLLFPANDTPHQAFLAFAIAGVTAGAVTTLSADLVAALSFVVPAVVPLIARLFTAGADIPMAMGAMVTLYLAFLVLSARRGCHNVRENICLCYEAAIRENDLRESEIQLIKAQEVSQTGSWKLDMLHDQLSWSQEVYRIFGVARGTPLSYEIFLGYVHPDDRAKVDAAWAAAKRGAPYDIEHRIMVDGQTRWVRERAHIECDPGLRPLSGIGTVQDITERKQAEEALRIAAIAFESREGMMVTDAKGVIERVNQAFTRFTGYSAEEAVGQTPALLHSGRQDKAFYERMWATLQEQKYWQGEIWNKRKNGKIYAEWLTISAVTAPDGSITHYVGIFSDISSNPEASAEIHRLAYYDPLTELPNRRMLIDRLGQALAASSRSKHFGALLFLDLDNFKTLNDTRGHDVGDLLLVEIAQRLNASMREGDTVARLGGDEFVLMLENLSEDIHEAAIQAGLVGEKVREAIASPYLLKGIEFNCTTSIGVNLFYDHEGSIEDLLKHADLAMYHAKKEGRNSVRFFDPEMQATLAERSALESDLRHALRHRQLHLFYQVQVDSARRAVGAEALLRWEHPGRGLILPEQFIPLAEETGLIAPIGLWVLRTACVQLRDWSGNPATRDLQLSVNVSARQLRQPDFVEQVRQVLSDTGINPALLKIELTESMVVDNVNDTVAKMHALKALGIGFSMDDFGTAYSSLAYLKQLPLDQLKIDQSFICDLASNPNDAAIVQAIVIMGRTFGLNVIAEGVETEAQLAFLDLHGCHAFQGYLFGKPLPIEEFEQLLAQHG